jgi:cell division GTPase FtsZ
MVFCYIVYMQNTDQQALFSSLAGVKLPLGQSSTGGLGAGGRYDKV